MEKHYKAEYQKFAGNGTISITLTPVEDNDLDSLQVQCPIDDDTVFTVMDLLTLPMDRENDQQELPMVSSQDVEALVANIGAITNEVFIEKINKNRKGVE